MSLTISLERKAETVIGAFSTTISCFFIGFTILLIIE